MNAQTNVPAISATRVCLHVMTDVSELLMNETEGRKVCAWVFVYVSWDAVVVVVVVTGSHAFPCCLPVDGRTGEASR